MSNYSIGVDLGGTNLRAAAISRDGNILDKISGRTDLKAGREAVICDMVEAIVTLRDRITGDRLAGVGIGVPGFILIEQGLIVGSNNLPDFEGFPVRDEIEKQLGTPVILENDANAAALGEKWMGAGKHVEDLVLLTLGTGIGGGIISQGRVLHGTVRYGRGTRTPDGSAEWEPMRLRQPGMPGKARVRYRHHGHGAHAEPGGRSYLRGRVSPGCGGQRESPDDL